MKNTPKSKIYTKAGDSGESRLFGGKKVQKDIPRVEAYGTVDELNSALGATASFVKDKKVFSIIKGLQNDLFDIGAELANSKNTAYDTNELMLFSKSNTEKLEIIIDQIDVKLPTIKEFIVPGGTNAASLLQLARTITRRAERRAVTLSKKESVNPNILMYLNRLSDLLFVLSRYLNYKAKIKETFWSKK
jgi:cob(I)alamin adenosyltransferase